MDVDVDTGLYSRQVFTIGLDAQKKLLAADFLIVGLGGLGVEVAKNIILTGAKSLSLLDEADASSLDLASQFFLTPAHVTNKINRAEASLPGLQQLNVNVAVSRVSGDLTDAAFLKRFTCIILCDVSFTGPYVSQVCELAHKNGVKIVAAESRGVAGLIFVDAGDKHTAVDRDGRNLPVSLITGVTADTTATVTVHDDDPHDLTTGDSVTITDINGPLGEHLNGKTFEVKVRSPTSFTIPVDTSCLPAYTRGGYCRAVQVPFTVSFEPLSAALTEPQFATTSTRNMHEAPILLSFFRALHALSATERGADRVDFTARVLDDAAVEKVIEETSRIFGGSLNPALRAKLRALAAASGATLSSMASLVGGQAAQEAMKVVTSKFVPVQQFWVYEDVKALPFPVLIRHGVVPKPEGFEIKPLASDEFTPTGSRYDSQIVAFGRTFDASLRTRRVFVVGAGALGCEYAKMFALMGVGTLIITDMDSIERSNLSRQFLFRSQHIGQPKSRVAGAAAAEFNPDVNVVVYEDRVGPQTEKTFDRAFWAKLDLVCNALDNVEARRYVDAQCVVHSRPLLECGTQGVMSNTQVVLPGLTLSYASTPDRAERSIAVCTLKLYPNMIDHTIQWARDRFEELFVNVPQALRELIADKVAFVARSSADPSSVHEMLKGMDAILAPPALTDFESCVKRARDLFDPYFRNQILQLTHNFPANARTASGEPFWSGPRRFPTALEFDATDDAHVDMIEATSCLLARAYGIEVPSGPARCEKTAARKALREQIIEIASRVDAKPWAPNSTEKLPEDEKAQEELAKAAAAAAARGIGEMVDALPPIPPSMIATPPPGESFEKDDDSNWHIQFITAVSNLRARNYAIEPADFEQTKRIAGRIVPAMITTTVLTVGLMGNEVAKVFDAYVGLASAPSGSVGPLTARRAGRDPEAILDDFLDTWVNVAIPFMDGSSPRACPRERWLPESYKAPEGKTVDPDTTLWHSIVVDLGKDATIQEVLDWFSSEYNLRVDMIMRSAIIWSDFGASPEVTSRIHKPLGPLLGSEDDLVPFLVMATYVDEEDEEHEVDKIPTLLYRRNGW